MLTFATPIPMDQNDAHFSSRVCSGNIDLNPTALPYPWAGPLVSDLWNGEKTDTYRCKGWHVPTIYGPTLLVYLTGYWAIEADVTVGKYDTAEHALEAINALRPGVPPMAFHEPMLLTRA